MQEYVIMKKLISIVVPVYNTAQYIERCIDSILNQTYSNIEVIIVDDGSSDNSGLICDNYSKLDTRVIVLHQKNKGVVEARNKGVNEAKGEYICFVDSDDWIEPRMIETLFGLIGDADLVSVGAFFEKSENNQIKMLDRYEEGIYKGDDFNTILNSMLYNFEDKSMHSLSSWIWNKMYRTSIAKEIHSKISPNLVFAEDTVFLLNYVLECKAIVISHQCFYHYVSRTDSVMNIIHRDMLANINNVYCELLPVFEQKNNHKLIIQLQYWVAERVRLAMNSQMGFLGDFYIPEYKCELKDIRDKSIILYGAGTVGQDLYKQMRNSGVNIVCWIDRNYLIYQSEDLDVLPVDELPYYDYDIVYIAVEKKPVFESIYSFLIENGVSADKIMWEKPSKILF